MSSHSHFTWLTNSSRDRHGTFIQAQSKHLLQTKRLLQTMRKIVPSKRLALAASMGVIVLWLLADFLVLSRFIEDDNPTEILLHGDGGWYSLKPNLSRFPWRWGDNRVVVSTDANGFRINPASPPPQPAEIAFLGDSFTFGMNGPWEDTFVGMFETRSRKAVVNGGTGSYSPTVYLHQYKRMLAAGVLQRPHTVILGLDISDVYDEAAVWEPGEDHPRKTAEAQAAEAAVAPRTLRDTIASNLRATREAYRLITRLTGMMDEPSDAAFDHPRSTVTWKNWAEIEPDYRPHGVRAGLEKIRANVQAVSALARENNGTLRILIYPWPAQLHHGVSVFDWERFALDLCAKIACPGVINTFPTFRSYASQHRDWYEALYGYGDIHFNRAGNQIVADELLAALSKVPDTNK